MSVCVACVVSVEGSRSPRPAIFEQYDMQSFTDFKCPPATFRPMPFWFWNGKLDPQRLERQIEEMYEKGIGGFFVHARFGLDTEYMSPGWMECVKASISAAERLGTEVWLYDENNFPSGIGNLKVSGDPEFSPKFVDLTETLVTGPATVSLKIPHGDVISARAVRRENGTLSSDSHDLMPMIRDGCLEWSAPPGEWQVMVFVFQVLGDPNGRVFGVDFLNRDATDLFIKITHDVYAREVGEHFGKTVKGFFVDEPTLLPWHHNIAWYGNRPHSRVVVWNQHLADNLAKQGMPASELVSHLFYTLDETSREKRFTFQRAVSKLYVESFFEPYRDWCDKHGLLLTGHLLLEEGLYCNTIFQADPVPALASMHVPGTDHLGLGAEYPYGGWAHLPRTITNIQGEKLVSSVAHIQGSERVLSETFGCAGWCVNLQDMKRITDWQYSVGINFMCPHAFFYTIEGFRKNDAPASHNHNASWPYYRLYADYTARLSYMLSGGTHIAQVAVLYPLEGFQSEYEIGREGEVDRMICDGFDALCTVLPKIHYDYDILDSGTVSNSSAEDGRLIVGDEAFDVIVIPPTPVLDAGVMDKLAKFRVSGGHVIELRPEAVEITRIPVGAVLALDPLCLEELGVHLREEIEKTVRPDVRIDSAEGALSSIRCLHRRKFGRDVYFLTNTSDAEHSATVSLDGETSLDLYDLETGDISSIPSETSDGRTIVSWSFPAYGSAIFVSSNSSEGVQHATSSDAPAFTIELPEEWEFSADHHNSLTLDRWEFRLDAQGNTNRFDYLAHFEIDDMPETLMLLLDDVEYRHALMGGMDITVCVNDREWRNPEFGEYLDPGFKTLDIASAVRQGSNAVRIVIAHDGWAGEPKLLTSWPKLIGDFEVADASEYRIRSRRSTLQTGSWADQGYPFYSGTVSYTANFMLPEDIGGRAVTLVVEDVDDMFEAIINGKCAGVRPWRPWRLDVGDFVHAGENTLTLRVTNSMQNFLESVPRASGLVGRVTVEVQ